MSANPEPNTSSATRDLPLLHEWAERLGAPLTPRQLDAFRIYRDELLAWNSTRGNLTAIKAPEDVETLLFLESLACAKALPSVADLRLIDIGTGGGFPGLPLALTFPALDVTLMDGTRKKVQFLEHVIPILNLHNTRAIHARAEDLALDPAHRDRYDVATARAVAPLRVLAEICLPFIRVGGVLIAHKGSTADREVEEAANALETLGAELQEIQRLDDIDSIPADHCLVIIRKTAPTLLAYPRRAGLPSRRPL